MAITPQKLKHRGTQMRNNKNQIITCPYTRYQNNKNNIRMGNYRVSRLPAEAVGTKDDMMATLRPKWGRWPPQKLKHRGTQMRNNKNQIITCPYTRYQNNNTRIISAWATTVSVVCRPRRSALRTT
jgi:hypothetical protein